MTDRLTRTPPRTAPTASHAPGVALATMPAVAYVALCTLVFSAGVIATRSAGWNAMIVQAHETVFVLGYLLFMRPASHIVDSLKANPLATALAAAWVFSITVSLVWSPFGAGTELLGHLRYQQTLMHVIVFLVVRDLLGRFPVPRRWVMLTMPASAVAVALVMAYLAYRLPSHDAATASAWFTGPPLNGHIRHTGYQVAAATAALFAAFLYPRRAPADVVLLVVVLVALWTFLFWMGGRASILSVCAAFGFVAMVAAVRGMPSRTLWLAAIISSVAGLIMAEALAVFSWNGVLSSVARTVEAEDLTRVTSGRLDLWRESWESVRPHLAFGLGPQGYLFMPNRSFGVQPHSMLLQFVVEWGLVGALPFVGLLGLGVWRGMRRHLIGASARVTPSALSAGAVIVALSVHGLVDGTYYHPQPSLYLAIAFAIWTLPPHPTARAEAGP